MVIIMIEVKCIECGFSSLRRQDSIDKSLKKFKNIMCRSCRAKTTAHLKPQCTKEFWNDVNKKLEHSESIKNSDEYYKSLKLRNTSGENNSMFGKTHSSVTKKKMSESRKGKFGENATAWKGGKISINKQTKRYCQKHYKWFSRIFERDKVCRKCGSNNKLDAHHIEPLSIIIKRIVKDMIFENDDKKLLYIVSHPDIIDKDLKNGICLCRSCHKEAHIKWGSHNAK